MNGLIDGNAELLREDGLDAAEVFFHENELLLHIGPHRPSDFGTRSRQLDWTPESRSSAKSRAQTAEAWPHERRCAEEAVAAAEAALGAGEDEAEGEGEVGQAVVRNRSLAVAQGFSSLPRA
jgi:hypothetical protein